MRHVDPHYVFPADFGLHGRTYLLWPVRPDNWRDDAKHAQHRIAALANLLSQYEQVTLGFPRGHDPRSSGAISRLVSCVEMQYDDIWVRDTGPLTLVAANMVPLSVDFRFNSWGGLFSSASKDEMVAPQIASLEGSEIVASDYTLEGGALASDGMGTIITTEESLLLPNRNPGASRESIEAEFERLLNARQVIWLPTGLANDEAGGHIDNVCLFVDSETILLSSTKDVNHPSFESLSVAKDILRRARNAAGTPYRVMEIPLPPQIDISAQEARGFDPTAGTIVRAAGTPLAPSYINCFLANGAVVVPTFNVATDTEALQVMKDLFPERTVVPFNSREFLLGGGAIHCLTKDIPNVPINQRGEATI